MNGCMLYIKLLELAVAAMIGILYMYPQKLEPTNDFPGNRRDVNPKNVFCFLSRRKMNESSVNVNDLLGVPPGSKVHKKFIDIVLCFNDENVDDDDNKCFCLQNFWWIALNLVVASTVALVSAIYVTVICCQRHQRLRRPQLVCLIICSAFVTIIAVGLGTFDILLLTFYWIFKYDDDDSNYYDPPIMWYIAGGLWGVFVILSLIEAMLYLVQLSKAKRSTDDSSLSSQDSLPKHPHRGAGPVGHGKKKEVIITVASGKSSQVQTANRRKSGDSSCSSISEDDGREKPIRLIPHHLEHHGHHHGKHHHHHGQHK